MKHTSGITQTPGATNLEDHLIERLQLANGLLLDWLGVVGMYDFDHSVGGAAWACTYLKAVAAVRFAKDLMVYRSVKNLDPGPGNRLCVLCGESTHIVEGTLLHWGIYPTNHKAKVEW